MEKLLAENLKQTNDTKARFLQNVLYIMVKKEKCSENPNQRHTIYGKIDRNTGPK